MAAFRIGLTGGLASGKSTVRRWLAEAGFLAVDADELVAGLYEPGRAGVEAIAELMGPEFITESGAVDRPKVAERVFSDDGLRRDLEEAIHPLVRSTFAEMAANSDAVASVLEATLLVEAGYRPDFDLIVSVESDPETQRRRAIERGLSPEQAAARLAAQGDGSARRAGADLILRNDGTLDELRTAVDGLIASVRRKIESSSDSSPEPSE